MTESLGIRQIPDDHKSRVTGGFGRLQQVERRINLGLPVTPEPVSLAEKLEEMSSLAARGIKVTWNIEPGTEWTFKEGNKPDPKTLSAIDFPSEGGISLTAEPMEPVDPYAQYEASIILEPAERSHSKAAPLPHTGDVFVAKVIRPIAIKVCDKPNPSKAINNGNKSKPEGQRNHGKKGKTHDTTGLTGFWRGTLYNNGVPVKNLPKRSKAK